MAIGKAVCSGRARSKEGCAGKGGRVWKKCKQSARRGMWSDAADGRMVALHTVNCAVIFERLLWYDKRVQPCKNRRYLSVSGSHKPPPATPAAFCGQAAARRFELEIQWPHGEAARVTRHQLPVCTRRAGADSPILLAVVAPLVSRCAPLSVRAFSLFSASAFSPMRTTDPYCCVVATRASVGQQVLAFHLHAPSIMFYQPPPCLLCSHYVMLCSAQAQLPPCRTCTIIQPAQRMCRWYFRPARTADITLLLTVFEKILTCSLFVQDATDVRLINPYPFISLLPHQRNLEKTATLNAEHDTAFLHACVVLWDKRD